MSLPTGCCCLQLEQVHRPTRAFICISIWSQVRLSVAPRGGHNMVREIVIFVQAPAVFVCLKTECFFAAASAATPAKSARRTEESVDLLKDPKLLAASGLQSIFGDFMGEISMDEVESSWRTFQPTWQSGRAWPTLRASVSCLAALHSQQLLIFCVCSCLSR